MSIAFLFPGQGSHQPGMAAAWDGHPAGRRFAEIGALTGMDLTALADDPEACAATAVAQPALFAASMASLEALRAAGVTADVVAGHSLGEVGAAVAAGALHPSDGAQLVTERGRAMGLACAASPGTMAAVLRLPVDELAGLVRRVPNVHVANDNAPGQVVVSGTEVAVGRLTELARAAGGRVLPLPVEGAFHSPAMTPACAHLETLLRTVEVRDPQIPLVSGTTGDECRSAAEVRRALVDGVLAPVRWRAVQERLVALGAELLVEVGPGTVLRGLARRTVPDVTAVSAGAPDDIGAVAELVRATRRTAISA